MLVQKHVRGKGDGKARGGKKLKKEGLSSGLGGNEVSRCMRHYTWYIRNASALPEGLKWGGSGRRGWVGGNGCRLPVIDRQ